MKQDRPYEPYRWVGIYHRIVFPCILMAVSIIFLCVGVANFADPSATRKQVWVVVTISAGALIVLTVVYALLARARHIRQSRMQFDD